MKTLYLDLFSGISGDMFLGALIDLGIDEHRLERELSRLKLDGYHLHAERRHKSGIAGVKFDVHLGDHAHDHAHHHSDDHSHDHSHGSHHHGSHHHTHAHSEEESSGHSHAESHGADQRNFAQIKKLISGSGLSPWVKRKALAVFQRIAVAEGKIHGLPPEQVHFHEVGAVDSIIDIVGACIGLEMLGKPRVLASHVVEGVGWVNCAHGRFPVPTPATLAILGTRGIGVTQCEEPGELITPTGAALIAEFAESFGPMQGLVAEKIGFGLGTRDNKTRPNVVRAVLGTVSPPAGAGSRKTATASKPPTRDWETDTVAVLETNLDDISPEILGNVVDKALAAGALDVFHTPIQMKKNRPAILLTVLCAATEADKFSEMLLRETSAFGVRQSLTERRKLQREFRKVKTKWGEVVVKMGRLNGEIVQTAPEFESCKAVSVKAKVPLKTIYEAALAAVHTPG